MLIKSTDFFSAIVTYRILSLNTPTALIRSLSVIKLGISFLVMLETVVITFRLLTRWPVNLEVLQNGVSVLITAYTKHHFAAPPS